MDEPIVVLDDPQDPNVVTHVTVEAVVTHADGTTTDHGVISDTEIEDK